MIAKHDSPASARKPVHGGFPSARRGLQAGDKVICMDDTGWLIPDPGFEHLSPVEGHLYTVREIASTGVSLMEGNPDHFYFAGRFLEVEAATELIRQRLAADPSPSTPPARPVHEFHGAE